MAHLNPKSPSNILEVDSSFFITPGEQYNTVVDALNYLGTLPEVKVSGIASPGDGANGYYKYKGQASGSYDYYQHIENTTWFLFDNYGGGWLIAEHDPTSGAYSGNDAFNDAGGGIAPFTSWSGNGAGTYNGLTGDSQTIPTGSFAAPSAENLWVIKISGKNSEDIALPAWVNITGNKSTKLTGLIDSESDLLENNFYNITECTITNLSLSAGKGLGLLNCNLEGGSCSTSKIIVNSGSVSGGNYSLATQTRYENTNISGGTFGTAFTVNNSRIVQGTISPTFTGGEFDNVNIPDFNSCTWNPGDYSFYKCYIDDDVTINMATPSTMKFYNMTWRGTPIFQGSITLEFHQFDFDSKSIEFTGAGIDVTFYGCSGLENTTVSGGAVSNNGEIPYDNTSSGLTAEDVQSAIDEVVAFGPHTRLHDIDSTSDHNGVSGATEDNFISFNGNGLPKDSGKSDSDYDDAGTASGLISTHESSYNHDNIHLQDSDSKIIVGDTEVSITDTGANGTITFKADTNTEATITDSGLTLSSGATINEFSIDDTLAGDSDTAVPTEQAVKAYVDNNIHTRLHDIDSTSDHNGVSGATENNIVSFDGNGLPKDSGIASSTVTSGVIYKGVWNATTNSPTLGNSGAGGTQGDYYKVSVAGSTSIDGETDWKIGDWIINNGTTWDKVDNTESVISVNTKTGSVVLDADDIDDTSTTNKFVTSGQISAFHTQNTDTKLDNGQANEVTSADLRSHLDSSSNPHSVTKSDVLTGDLIVNADVDSGAAIVESKLSLNYATHDNSTDHTQNTDTKILVNDTEVSITDTGANGTITFKADTNTEATISDSGLTLASGATINEFSIDDTLAGDSDTAVPTEQAVKAYVDGAIHTQNTDNLITQGNSNVTVTDAGTGEITITADGNEEVSITDAGVQLGAAGARVNEFSTDDTLTGDSDTAVPTEQAVKAYVDNNIHTQNTDTKILVNDTEVSITDTGANGTIAFKADSNTEMTISDSGVQLASGATINEFSIDDTLSGDSDTAVPTEQAVKAYVDNIVNSVVLFDTGIESISNSSSTVSVTFASALANTNYTINATIVNTTDGSPSQYAYTVTAKATTGFTVTLSGDTDSANYDLEWQIMKF